MEMKTRGVTMAMVLALMLAGSAVSAPIHVAAWKGDLAQVRNILKQDPGQISSWDDDQQRNPLHIAAQRDNLELARLLLQEGADPNAVGVKSGEISYSGIGVTPLHIAAGKGNLEMARILLAASGDPNAPSVPTWSLLAGDSVAEGEALAVLESDLKTHGKTPLHFAAIRGQTDMARLLLQSGATLDARDAEGQTPAMLAAFYRRDNTLAFLAEQKCDLAATSKHGFNLLHFAAAGASRGAIELALAHGLNINASACLGPETHCLKITPLHLASLRGAKDIVQLLLQHGANPAARAGHGASSADLAAGAGHPDTAALLQQQVAVK
jgi:ankyrin repeat protein